MITLQLNNSTSGLSVNDKGFHVVDVKGLYSVGGMKKIESSNDNLSSKNYYISRYAQDVDFSIKLLGKFPSIVAAESALYSLYGVLVQPGETTFQFNGDVTRRVKGYMNNGAKVKHTIASGHVVFEVELKLKKTND
jgi:hypothetical protein